MIDWGTMNKKSKYKVKIEIVGGVPSIIECPPEVDVEITQVNHWQRFYQELKKKKEGTNV